MEVNTLYFVTIWSIILPLYTVSGFQCYSCSYTYSGDPTLTYECVDAPENVTGGQPIMNCDQYCTIDRQWDGSLEGGRGAIRSFHRGCGPSIGNICNDEQNTDRETCFTSCQEDLCNSGSGSDPNNPTDTSDPDVEAARGNQGDDSDDNNDDNGNGNEDNVDDRRNYYYNAAFSHSPAHIIVSFLMLLTICLGH